MRVRSSFLYFLILIIFPTVIFSQSINRTPEEQLGINDSKLKLLGEWAYGDATAVTMYGSNAIVSSGRKIMVFDVADPTNPTNISEVTTPDEVLQLQMDGTNLIVANSAAGISIFDLSTITAPTLINTFATKEMARGFELVGNILYVADNNEGLTIFDISDVTNPVEHDNYNDFPVLNLAISGPYAYVAAGYGELQVYDISNIDNIVETGSSFSVAGQAWVSDVLVRNNILYIDADSLYIADATDPMNIIKLGSRANGSLSLELTIDGDHLFASNPLQIYDISDPANPILTGEKDISNMVETYGSGDILYVAGGKNGFLIFNILDPSNIEQIYTYKIGESPNSIFVRGDNAFLSGDNYFILDVADPFFPHTVSSVAFDRIREYSALKDNYAYVAGYNTSIIDISDIENPSVVVDSIFRSKKVLIQDTLLYTFQNEFRIYSLSNPLAPEMIYERFVDPVSMAVDDSIIAIGDRSSGIYLMNASNPLDVERSGRFGANKRVYAVDIKDDKLISIDATANVEIWDISDPTNAQLLNTYVAAEGISNGIWFYDYAVLGSDNGVYLVDMSDPSNPTQTEYFDTPGKPLHFFPTDSLIYIADEKGGFQILQPNQIPFVDITSPNGGEISISNKEFDITWRSDEIATVTIEYSTDNGGQWQTIATGLQNTGTYTWMVPQTISENCIVRISDESTAHKDISDDVFSIVGIDKYVLEQLYNATNGENWTDNTNWLSDQPIDQWYGVETDGNDITVLNLSNNGLTDTLPNDLGSLKKIEELHFDGNALMGNIPDSLENCTTLKIFNVANNMLGDSLPNIFSGMDSLQILNISNNQYVSLPDLQGLDNLSELHIESNVLLFDDIEPIVNAAPTVTYSPQAKFGTAQDTGLYWGQSYTVVSQLADSAYNYRWYRNGELIQDNEDSLYTITFMTVSDSGAYTHKITYDNVPDLELESEAFTIHFLSSENFSFVSPALQDTLIASSQDTIRWITSFADTVKLEYSTNAGVDWSSITEGTTDTFYIWDVPYIYEDSCKIRASMTNGGILNETELFMIREYDRTRLEEFYTITNGTSWSNNTGWLSEQTIDHWNGISISDGRVTSIELSNNNIVSDIPNLINDFEMLEVFDIDSNEVQNIPTLALSHLKTLRVSYNRLDFDDLEPNANAASDLFVYGDQKTDFVATDTVIIENESYEMTFDAGGTSTTYQWFLDGNELSGADSTVYTIAKMTSSDSGNYHSVASNALLPDLSFTSAIRHVAYEPLPKIALTFPIGDETFNADSNYVITWTYENIENIRIDLSTDNGEGWTEIATVPANGGSYLWTAPSLFATECFIRVSDATNVNVSDTNDTAFTIYKPGSILIKNPVGGEEFLVGSTQTIRWTATSDVDSIEIWFTYNNWDSSTELATLSADETSYEWLVPDNESTICYFSVRDKMNPEVADTIDTPFTIYQIRELRLTNPVGGERFFTGSVQEITWEASETIDTVIIEFTSNNWASQNEVARVPASDAVYYWEIPDVSSGLCFVSIRDINHSEIADTNDSPFLIYDSESVHLLRPIGGEEWLSGSTEEIQWIAPDEVDSVHLYFSYDNWITSERIGTFDAELGAYQWLIPDVESDECYLSVIETTNAEVGDSNDTPFSIYHFRDITLTSPEGSEQWLAGSTQEISWTNTQYIDSVIISFTFNNWSTSEVIATVDVSAGSYSWTLPDISSGDCFVSVTAKGFPEVADTNTSPFIIYQPEVKIISLLEPDGGESYEAKSDQTIRWNATENIDSIHIFFTQNNWTTSELLISLPANQKTYNWIAPDIHSENCAISIVDTKDTAIGDSSDASFFIFQTKILELTAPQGGEQFFANDELTIRWNAIYINNINIEYSTTTPQNWITIAENIDASANSYIWSAPAVSSSDVRIRIKDSNDQTITSVSDPFTVLNPQVQLTAPAGGEEFYPGETLSITWTTNDIHSLSIFISYDNASAWETIAESVDASLEEYNWTIPDRVTNAAKIKIADKENPNRYYDQNETVFTINPTKVPNITISESNIDFGKLLVGRDSTQSITISNNGLADLIVEGYEPQPDWLSLNISDAVTIEPGSEFTLTVTFSPLAQTDYSTDILLLHNDSDTEALFTVTGMGIDYPTVISLSHTLTFPTYDSTDQYQSSDYRLFGIPGTSGMLVGELMNGTQGEDWEVYRDNGSTGTPEDYYQRYNGTSTFVLSNGRAYWIINRGSLTISGQTVNSAELNDLNEAIVPLNIGGYTIITNPFNQAVQWSDVQAANGITQSIYSWSGTSWNESTTLQPYIGYVFDNRSAGLNELRVPYIANANTTAQKTLSTGFTLGIELQCGKYNDRITKIGINTESKDKLDSFDERRPRGIESVPQVFMNRKKWDAEFPYFVKDFRRSIEDVQEWNFIVSTPLQDEVQLRITNIEMVNQDFAIYLLDEHNGQAINLRENSTHTFDARYAEYPMSVIIGDEAKILEKVKSIIPQETKLHQNFPNPFNPETTIPLSLSEKSVVTIEVYDILGQKVSTIYNGVLEQGNHHFVWNAYDAGVKTTGVYFYRCRANRHVFTKKMLLIK